MAFKIDAVNTPIGFGPYWNQSLLWLREHRVEYFNRVVNNNAVILSAETKIAIAQMAEEDSHV